MKNGEMEKQWFLLAKIRNFPPAKISFFLEKLFPPNSNNRFHLQKNIFDSLFPPDRKSISTIRRKDLFKEYVFSKRQSCFRL